MTEKKKSSWISLIVAPVVAGIIIFHYEKFFERDSTNSSKVQTAQIANEGATANPMDLEISSHPINTHKSSIDLNDDCAVMSVAILYNMGAHDKALNIDRYLTAQFGDGVATTVEPVKMSDPDAFFDDAVYFIDKDMADCAASLKNSLSSQFGYDRTVQEFRVNEYKKIGSHDYQLLVR